MAQAPRTYFQRYYCTNCGPFEWNREYSQEDSRGTNCPDCMIGMCQRKDAISARVKKTQHTLQQVNWDLAMFNEISFEGFRYALIITDSFSG